MAELTAYGLERDNRTQIINKLSSLFRDYFGNDLLLTNDSIAGMFVSLLAELKLEGEKLAEDIYYSRTLNGAEGIYLDDLLGRYGFTRRGKLPGSGAVQIHYDYVTTPSNRQFNQGDEVSAENSITYESDDNYVFVQNIVGQRLDASGITPGTYNVSIRNTSTEEVVVQQVTLTGPSVSERQQFVQDLASVWLTNTTDNINFVQVIDQILYVGYNSALSFVSITEPTYFEMSPKVGELWTQVEVTAQTEGYYELPQGGVTGISPTFTGFIEATNVDEFYPGAENESDAEYRARFVATRGTFPSSTREGMLDEIRDLDGVESVRIYDNPTLTDMVSAPALTFNTVVRGGSNQDIAQTIYDNKPINVNTSGSTSISINTSDGDVEIINFTKAEPYLADVRLNYRLNSTSPLTAAERSLIENNIINLFEAVRMGDTIYNTQLISAVLSSLPANRLTTITVEVKRSIEPEGSYSQSDIETLFSEYVTLNSLTFNREF